MHRLMLLAGLALVAACSPQVPDPAQSTPAASAPADAAAPLNALVEEYFEETLKLDPVGATFIGDNRYNDRLANSIGPEHRAAASALNHQYLAALREIDPASLDGEALLTWQMAVWSLETELAGERFPSHLLPINQFFSMPAL